MIRHTAILGIFVAFLVCCLFYFMSPDEVRIAYAGVKRKLSGAAVETFTALHWRAPRFDELPAKSARARVRRDLIPDPFRMYGERPSAGVAASIGRWIYPPRTPWMLALAGAAIWLGRRARKKRFQLAAEEKMAATLDRAVRQMSAMQDGL